MAKIIQGIQKQSAMQVTYNENLLELLNSRCTEIDRYARNMDHILNAYILPDLATEILMAKSKEKLPKLIHIDVQQNEILYSVDQKIKTVKKSRSKNNTADVV